ncbi:MAG: Gfo/Idh/MocA family oxidoreductase [Planctomycetaceae bacterium]|nr:Gfo/Idh/MocA family oxidoreductase [Planctomycetaceae bacterium]
MSKLTRRQFVKAAAASTVFAPFTIAGTKASGKVLGANDRIRHGVVGVNGRGSGHLSELSKVDGVDLTYLIDVDTRVFDSKAKIVEEKWGVRPTCVQDVRKALDDPNLDTISIATCNHTHSLISIWACQAGKDVYVEKPLSHNIYEGRKLVEAAHKYDRVVMHGTQSRSSQKQADEVSAVQSGKYGQLLVSKGYCCKPRWSIGFKPVTTPPPEVDFNLWLGPAPEQPFHENLVHYNWHWFWDFGNGDTGNQGVHQMDIALWGLADGTLPTRVWSVGGRFGEKDQGQTPNTQVTVFEYGDAILLFETRGLVGKDSGIEQIVTNEFYTTEGKIHRGKFYPLDGGDAVPLQPSNARQVTEGGPFGSFMTAVRHRRPELNNAPAAIGHASSALCHLANIAYRVGEPADLSTVKSRSGDNPQVLESFAMVERNLAAVGADPRELEYTLSRQLEFDPQSERFTSNDANTLLTRDYRKPFVVPDVV